MTIQPFRGQNRLTSDNVPSDHSAPARARKAAGEEAADEKKLLDEEEAADKKLDTIRSYVESQPHG